jgi:squalene-hopene/tetraprenyl-beta-curcumene cyclase
MLAVAAFNLTGVPVKYADILQRAQKYIDQAGGIRGLRARYGKDKTFSVPILTNCALAGMVPWKKVPSLPFELACVGQDWYRWLQLPVVSYAIPALVAIGQAKFHHARPWNPLLRYIRGRCVEPSLELLRKMQPASGGYLEAIPLTSFVVMSLASIGRVNHPVTQAGLEFIVESVREYGSWAIDTDLATWNTTLALNALAAAGEDIWDERTLRWLLGCQHVEKHPYTGAAPGGWGWSDLSGAVPDADDTPGALLALAHFRDSPQCDGPACDRIGNAAAQGVDWLLNLQNADGGWPTFCRGWGTLPFDRSGADLTAHAIRALIAWRSEPDIDATRVEKAIGIGLEYIGAQQRADGSWVPLWFGNQENPREENPVYGTAKVLLAYRDLARDGYPGLASQEPAICRGVQWLIANQNADGGWGGGPLSQPVRGKTAPQIVSSVEETSLAVEAMLAAQELLRFGGKIAPLGGGLGQFAEQALARGLDWLVSAVEENRHDKPSPIGFYFAKLWYYEKLYPLTFAASALGQASLQLIPPAQRSRTHAHLA